MDEGISEGEQGVEERQPTAPANISVTLRCFESEEHARQFGNLVSTYVHELSRQIDLSTLDGITIAGDYAQALRDLDRGYTTTYELAPSDGFAVGVAMTPAVIRDGKLKSHMVFAAALLLPLEDQAHEGFQLAFHMLAHECAHVEVTHRFDAAFPNVLLRTRAPNLHANARDAIIKGCWDEFAVCSICAPFGADPTVGYEDTFLEALSTTRAKANQMIKAYRRHANHTQIMEQLYGTYGKLMKFACYHLGNMAGRGLTVDDLPNTKAALENHWFKPHFEKLDAACKSIAEEYGRWSDRRKFEAIGDIADDVVREGGLSVSGFTSDGGFNIVVPFTPETL